MLLSVLIFVTQICDLGFRISSQSKTKFGWTLGGGVEAALAANWSLKAEYLYMDLGSVSGSVPDNFGGTVSWDTEFTDHIVRVGLNYRFY